jgi:hypothetical protein
MYISDNARSMMNKPEFTAQEKAEQIDLVRFKVSDLGFPQGATTKDIYAKVAKLGLELCSSEVGPRLRLDYNKVFNREQPKGDWFFVGMEPIGDSNSYPDVFYVNRSGDGKRWLLSHWAEPEDEWSPEDEFVFRARKLEA